MSFEDSFHLFIRIEEFDDFCLPAAGGGKIQKQKDQHLQRQRQCKQGVCDFKHKLIGYYNNLNILYTWPREYSPTTSHAASLPMLSHIFSLVLIELY